MTAIMPTLRGVFLVPGVSKNKRLYTPAAIGKAVDRMRARINDPDGLPITMRTSHGAGDRSELIVARVTGVSQRPDGAAEFEARLYDTAPARDIAALVQPADGAPPALRSVSISGSFLGDVKNVVVDGEACQTAADIEIDAIDFTARPGVTGAVLATARNSAESATYRPGVRRVLITETWEAPVPSTVPVTASPSDAAFERLLETIRTAFAAPAAPAPVTPVEETLHTLTDGELGRRLVRRLAETHASPWWVSVRENDARATAAQSALAEQAAALPATQPSMSLTEALAAGRDLRSPSWTRTIPRTVFDA